MDYWLPMIFQGKINQGSNLLNSMLLICSYFFTFLSINSKRIKFYGSNDLKLPTYSKKVVFHPNLVGNFSKYIIIWSGVVNTFITLILRKDCPPQSGCYSKCVFQKIEICFVNGMSNKWHHMHPWDSRSFWNLAYSTTDHIATLTGVALWLTFKWHVDF